MQKILQNKLKYIFSFILLVAILISNPSLGLANSVEGKKALVFILDEISLEEILDSDTPNLDRLMENGGLGFMNVRAKSSVNNKASSYLSLGMGVRTLSSTQGGLAFDNDSSYSLSNYNSMDSQVNSQELYSLYTEKNLYGEIFNIAIEDIRRTAQDVTPNNQVGLLGKIARENDLTIGVIGNSDISGPSREFTLMAMDENGVIPYGAIGSDLLSYDNTILGGLRLDETRLLEEADRILDKTDILFLNYGDSSRVQRNDRLASDEIRYKQKLDVVNRADQLVGQLMSRLDMDNTLFMLVSPNPSKNMIKDGNFGLTPFILSNPGLKKGLLTSSTTNREGLVTNFDFAPTLLDFFQIREGSFIGEAMSVIDHASPDEVLLKNQSDYLYLRKYRKVFHWAYIGLIIVALLGYMIAVFTRFRPINKKILDHISLTILALPITMMTVSIWGYKNIVLDMAYVFLLAFLLGLVANKLLKSLDRASLVLCMASSLLLLVDAYLIRGLMIISPLGSDAIAGGRFYGIGNDYMGILVGSSLLGLFTLYNNKNTKKSVMSLLTSGYLLIIMLALSPLIGANMGGTLSVIAILLGSLFVINDKKLSFKRIIILGLGVVALVIAIASLDAVFNPNPTHAGKAISALANGGYAKLWEIISIKLRQVFWNLFNASWNIVLFLQLIIFGLLYRFKRPELEAIKLEETNLYKGFFILLLGSLVIFLFNDTGTIAAAMSLSFLSIPLARLLYERRQA